jgi:hypothetical protein
MLRTPSTLIRFHDRKNFNHFEVKPLPGVSRPKIRCEEAHCDHWIAGWQTICDVGTKFGWAQAGYIRHMSGRRFEEELTGDGILRFTFYPGQQCFSEHFEERDGVPVMLTKQVAGRELVRVGEVEKWRNDWNESVHQTQKQKQEGF